MTHTQEQLVALGAVFQAAILVDNLWYDVLKRSGIADTYDAFKTAFLTSYAPALTARTATVNLHDIKQTAQESIVAFYSRVIKAVNDLENLLPAAQRTPAAAAYPAEVVALAGYAALAANVRADGIANLINTGITTAMNHIGLQLFVAGLRSSIRDELMKNMPVSLWAAFQSAMAMEKITSTPRITAAVNQVSTEQPESEGEMELEIACFLGYPDPDSDPGKKRIRILKP